MSDRKTPGEKLADAMIDKAVEGISEIEFMFDDVEICGLSEQMSEMVSDVLAEDEAKKIMREKVLDTLKKIDTDAAAKHISLTWGELIGAFLHKIKMAIGGGK